MALELSLASASPPVGGLAPPPPLAPPGKEQQVAGVGILLQISMLVLSFVLGHVLRRHRFYYLPEASASLLIGLVVGGLANISNTETNTRYMLAEGLGLSGIVSILFTGMVMKHYTYSNLSDNSQRFVSAFFHLLSSLAETFVFIYMGFDIAMEEHSWSHVGFIFFSIVLLIGGSTGTMLEALDVVGDENTSIENYEDNNGYMPPTYEEGTSSGGGLRMKLKQFHKSTTSFTALDKNYLTPFFTSQTDEDDDDFSE
nr:unnamed protein product [Digitaria exilis]